MDNEQYDKTMKEARESLDAAKQAVQEMIQVCDDVIGEEAQAKANLERIARKNAGLPQ